MNTLDTKIKVGQVEKAIKRACEENALRIFTFMSDAFVPASERKQKGIIDFDRLTPEAQERFDASNNALKEQMQDLRVLRRLALQDKKIDLETARNDRAYRLQNAARHFIEKFQILADNAPLPLDKQEGFMKDLNEAIIFLSKLPQWFQKAKEISA